MRKLIFFAFLILLVFNLSGCNLFKKKVDNLTNAKNQHQTYLQYKPEAAEFGKLSRFEHQEDGTSAKITDIYYYGANGKRYVFPNADIFKSWFGDYDINSIKQEDLETLYKTSLGGNVFLRPGSLLTTPSIFDTYLVMQNGQIRKINDPSSLDQIYGSDWKKSVYSLPEFYFSQYTSIEPIIGINDFPEIPTNLTINQDKGL